MSKFEHDRPEHQIHHKQIPQGHAHMDQKYDKGMRSPIVGQFPDGNGLVGDSESSSSSGESY